MPTSQAFVEYFRCSQDYANFESAGDSRVPAGFFRFGTDAICFGQLSAGFVAADAKAELHDAGSDVRVENGLCVISFDPDGVIENLRRERYIDNENSAGDGPIPGGFVRKAYYAARPLLPVSVRKHLQRMSLKGWDQRTFPAWPVDRSVDKTLEKLMLLAIRTAGVKEVPFIWFWPEGKMGCAIMTHDVETKAGLDFCPSLMDLNDSYGIKSSFQIIPEGRYQATNQILDGIRNRGFEVNVHDWNHDGHLFSNSELFLSRVAKINQAVEQFEAKGFRSGGLYRNLNWYNSLNFCYDMSVPNMGNLDPQPGGCCTVMPYFIGDILEIPLTTTQDYSLFEILRDFSIEVWKRQIDLILERQGLISFDVHPDYVIETRARDTYSRLLDHLTSIVSKRDVWLTLPGEVNQWWRQRSQMKLVESNGRFHIEGPGKERARIAYARVEGERVVYTLA